MTAADVTSGPSVRYTTGAIVFHWLIAVMIIGQVLGAWWMTDLPDGETKFLAYQWHKTFGLLVLFLSFGRLAWRFLNPPPPEPPMPAWQSLIAKATHWIFYGLIIAIPVSGWLMVSASPRGVPTQLFNAAPWPHLPIGGGLEGEAQAHFYEQLYSAHEVLAYATLALLFVHIGAALKHQFIDRDNLLARMAPGLFGKTQAPDTRRTSVATAAAVILVPLGLGVTMAQIGAGSKADRPEATLALADGAPGWSVDYAASTLTLEAQYNGAAILAPATNWSAAIAFSPENLAASSARVVVDAGALKTGDAFFDGTMAGNDGLKVSDHPEIVFETATIRASEAGGYVAEAELSLAGQTQSVTFPFTLQIDGDAALMTGALTVDRFDWDLGVINDAAGQYVGPTITVTASVAATRAD